MPDNKPQISLDTYSSVSSQAHEILTSPQPGDVDFPMPSNSGDTFFSEFMCDKSAFEQFAVVVKGVNGVQPHIAEHVEAVAERLSDFGSAFISSAEALAIRCVAKDMMVQGGVKLPTLEATA